MREVTKAFVGGSTGLALLLGALVGTTSATSGACAASATCTSGVPSGFSQFLIDPRLVLAYLPTRGLHHEFPIGVQQNVFIAFEGQAYLGGIGARSQYCKC